jgi:two-component system, chemotaxis family, chemotaxis protein CheY
MLAPRILIVDDSKVSRMLIRAIVAARRPEAVITEAGTADEANIQLESAPFDLAIFDMNMPGMSGLELAEHLNKSGKLPAHCAMLTANVQDSTRLRAESLGLKFFRKPVAEPVIDAILGLLEGA